MAYTLDEFCADSRAALKAAPLPDALPQIAERLARLLSNPAFVAATFSDDMPPGRRILHHDPETDFYVLAHVQEGKKTWVIRVTGTNLDVLPRYHFGKQDRMLEQA